MPRLPGRPCASLSYAAGQALAQQAPNFGCSPQLRGSASSHSPQRQVYGRRLSATLKDLQVGMARQLILLAPPSWDLLMQSGWTAGPDGSANRVLITRTGSMSR